MPNMMGSFSNLSKEPLTPGRTQHVLKLALLVGLLGFILAYKVLADIQKQYFPADYQQTPEMLVNYVAEEPFFSFREDKLPQGSAARMAFEASVEVKPHCNFFASGYHDRVRGSVDGNMWGNHTLCEIPETLHHWSAVAQSDCTQCVSGANVCESPRFVIYHMYRDKLNKGYNWESNVLAIQSLLLTQNLKHMKIWVWTRNVQAIYTEDTKNFFDTFSKYVEIKHLDYDYEVQDTPLASSKLFSSYGSLISGLDKHIVSCLPEADKKQRTYLAQSAFSDIWRYTALHNYGGMWVDNDMIFLSDMYPMLNNVGYQFTVRWIIGHTAQMYKQSALAKRVLQTIVDNPIDELPYLQEKYNQTIHDCFGMGYVHIAPPTLYDIYCQCVIGKNLIYDNSGEPDNIWVEYPLTWFDQHVLGCPWIGEKIDQPKWTNQILSAYALHTRYPKLKLHEEGDTSQIGRAIAILQAYYSSCNSLDCLPTEPWTFAQVELHLRKLGLLS